jgi:hypothetical protein
MSNAITKEASLKSHLEELQDGSEDSWAWIVLESFVIANNANRYRTLTEVAADIIAKLNIREELVGSVHRSLSNRPAELIEAGYLFAFGGVMEYRGTVDQVSGKPGNTIYVSTITTMPIKAEFKAKLSDARRRQAEEAERRKRLELIGIAVCQCLDLPESVIEVLNRIKILKQYEPKSN